VSTSGYQWRSLTPDERRRVLESRRFDGRPAHSPPHLARFTPGVFLVTAACFDHRPIIGMSPERMDSFADALMAELSGDSVEIHAWCVLPNHYHVLIRVSELQPVLHGLALLHGRTSHRWNGEDGTRGRKVFFRAMDRAMRSEAHFFASLNYVHNNAVHHGYVEKWTDWPWSSARGFLESVGRIEAERLWTGYPVRNFGARWDDAAM
jgi:putative transposase